VNYNSVNGYKAVTTDQQSISTDQQRVYFFLKDQNKEGIMIFSYYNKRYSGRKFI